MPEPLLLLDGVFGQDEDGTHVHMDRGLCLVDEALSGFVDHEVTIELHHFPPGPVDKSLPGGGSCLWGGHCPHGHQVRPGWLHAQSVSGILTHEQDATQWVVGGVPLRLDLMPGHYGRLILVDDDALKRRPSADASVDALLQEAGQMASLLESLKGVLRE